MNAIFQAGDGEAPHRIPARQKTIRSARELVDIADDLLALARRADKADPGEIKERLIAARRVLKEVARGLQRSRTPT
jgi:hypothetical protein